MARKGQARPRAAGPLPPPLPPEKRTVGQLIAESVRFYRHHFFQTLPLGLSVAALTQVSIAFERDPFQEPRGHPPPEHRGSGTEPLLGGGLYTTAILGGVLLTLSFIVACILVSGRRPDARHLASAFVAGVLVFLPVPILALLYVLPAVAWLAFVGLVVPVVVIEALPVGAAFRRAIHLARADFVHAFGGLATMVIVFVLTRLFLLILLQSAGESTERAGAFLADLVLSPLLFVGTVLLYYDQTARFAKREGLGGVPQEA